ncbi:DUF6048 family protein [Nafulsella turpanensis]|uniref:DUF6048 family protein n=1 Tax=Nafulsella turpanensis TaxID=1265690 RepID=UPI00034AD1B7|nr:DUF6048 family protein [Nafulsella turpanensis]
MPVLAFGQEEPLLEKDSLEVPEVPAAAGDVEVPEDSTFDLRPQGLRIGVDVSHLVGQLVDQDGRFYELKADVIFGRYLLSADWGTGRRYRSEDGLDYRSSGSYFRIGPDVNFVADNDDLNALFIGLRYGQSFYEERLVTSFSDPTWGSFPVTPERQTSAFWFEGVAGLKARIWKGLFMGYTLRYKFGLNVQEQNSFISYEVPGFGKVGDGANFSFSYHLSYLIPLGF